MQFMPQLIDSVEEAQARLTEAKHDVAADFGFDAADDAHGDLVRNILPDCTPEIAEEFARREGVMLPACTAGSVCGEPDCPVCGAWREQS